MVWVGVQVFFICMFSEVVFVGEVFWYINGVVVQLDDVDWIVIVDGSYYVLLLCSVQFFYVGEVIFVCCDVVVFV